MFTSTLGPMAPLVSLAAGTLLKATVLLILVAIAAHLLRRRSAALRHLLWTLAIVGLVALPVLTPLVPFRLGVLPATTSRAVERLTSESSGPSSREPDEKQGGEAVTPPPVSTGAGAQPADPVDANQGGGFDLTTFVVVMWLAGASLLFARFAIGLIIVHGIARRSKPLTGDGWPTLTDRSTSALGVRSSVAFRCSGEIAMPFACGLIRPTIVLPSASEEWTLERREAVLMHELAHISRGDLAMNTLSHFVRALYWFHPLAWLAAYRLRVEGERACDDAVLRAGALPSDYAEHLLSIVRSVGKSVPSAA
ncbi:MAG: M56 family metallopeptidase, partial [Gemmatimonadaceae bacterium]